MNPEPNEVDDHHGTNQWCANDNDDTVEHIPVLATTLIEQVALPPDGIMVDATMGQGGHSFLFGQQLSAQGMLIGLDIDEDALDNARKKLWDLPCQLRLYRSNFSRLSQCLSEQSLGKVDFILADLGYSSVQLKKSEIGISFQEDMPLDMRIDRSLTTTAADIVNRTHETALADLIFEYGQDRASRRIARFIVQQRQREPICTTKQLAAIVCKALYRPGQTQWKRLHPATRTFQALRIAVNHELENLTRFVEEVPDLLTPGGFIAVISFHSLEDRIVKNNFKMNRQKGLYTLLTKKPLVPTKEEIDTNPRSRSAKLRIARKNK